MSSLNKVMLIGRVGHTPEINKEVNKVKLSLATSEKWQDKESGEKKEKTEWHNIVGFGNLSDLCKKYVNKGDLIYIEGKLQTRQWEDKKTKEKKYITEIVMNNIVFLESSSKKEQKDNSSVNKNYTDDIPF